jgi:hypothetical protein
MQASPFSVGVTGKKEREKASNLLIKLSSSP